MKNLVLTSLFVATASQAAGCIIFTDDGGSPGTVTADVTVSSAGGGALTTRQGDGVRLSIQGGGLVQEIFNPASGVYTTTEVFEPGTYTFTVDYINDFSGTALVVDSTNQVSIEVDGDVAFDVNLAVGNGFFGFNWSVETAGGAPVTSCAAIPGENGVSILSTLAGTADAIEDLFNCEDGLENPNSVATDPLPIGAYVVSASILDAQGAALGVAAAENLTIPQGNDYVEAIVAIVLN